MALPVKNLGIPGAFEATCGIQEPTTCANNFEIKPALINLVQSHPFCGKSNESPHKHLKQFEHYCDTIKHNGVTSDYVRLTLFRFSLLGRASDWLDKEVKPNSLRTWNEVTSAFLNKFYSHGKTAEFRHKIQSFEQGRDESLFEAWDRFKEYQRECPHHGIPKWLLLQKFYLGLSPSSKTSLDAGAGGPIMNKTEDQIEEIIEDVVENYQSWHVGERSYDGKSRIEDGKGSVYAIEQARMIEKLSSRLEKLENTPFAGSAASKPPSPSTIPSPSATLLNKGKGKVIENQLAQLASTIREHHALTILPPKSHTLRQINAIVTRSGKILDDVPRANKVSKPNGEDQEGVIGSSDNDVVEEEPLINDEGDPTTPKVATLLPLPTPKLPYPQRFIRHKLDVQFAKFLEVLRKLHITLPFTDALKQMPTYSRFLKKILSGKRNCDVKETVNLTENCSAIILNKMPPKLKDPGSFTIPCAIKELEISNALCDLGDSVSLMPYSVFSKLEVGDLVPTNITLQLADRSLKYPIGKIDDVPLRVGGLVIPVDFVVLDIDEDVHVPIILGRPFLATAGAIIDVKQGNITLKVGMDSCSLT
ncbi:uncharacterized protein [Spinacia oleracea]|uniref:Retrotransposon gag domain-containing protein n=1 Tax=Spinacia oleracea TaxID=3562 RepID=A0ABM3QR10_SPIOL|nr:uncharacterized protein LOC110791241 [Spinacia oleracea]